MKHGKASVCLIYLSLSLLFKYMNKNQRTFLLSIMMIGIPVKHAISETNESHWNCPTLSKVKDFNRIYLFRRFFLCYCMHCFKNIILWFVKCVICKCHQSFCFERLKDILENFRIEYWNIEHQTTNNKTQVSVYSKTVCFWLGSTCAIRSLAHYQTHTLLSFLIIYSLPFSKWYVYTNAV